MIYERFPSAQSTNNNQFRILIIVKKKYEIRVFCVGGNLFP